MQYSISPTRGACNCYFYVNHSKTVRQRFEFQNLVLWLISSTEEVQFLYFFGLGLILWSSPSTVYSTSFIGNLAQMRFY